MKGKEMASFFLLSSLKTVPRSHPVRPPTSARATDAAERAEEVCGMHSERQR